ncbi:hypothetical protein [Paenibacillus harenae]|uniref:hypothetical protein n=1 Tax=Paenibacillus harenae TaxID=306543 RepID=UPI002794174F|nr:hypothetical protein [Paenibacillus harenae]MDQ0058227.1 hypothetical protein [Paenibacillus harenae]
MEKKLSANAMLYSIGFVFMLACSVGAFFYGIEVGVDKTESRYEAEKASASAKATVSPYQQQDLVSFYHTVFLPYREFQSEWFDAVDKLTQGESIDAASAFKELSSLAKNKAGEASSFNMQNSPLLGEAQVSYIRSLKLFADAASKAAASAKSAKGEELLQLIAKEKNYATAVAQSLAAQQAYYDAMLKWSSSVNVDIPSEYKLSARLDLAKWETLPITVKNKLMADQLQSRKQITAFYPHDLTSRVDEFIISGQAAKMKLGTVSGIVALLLDTDAVRSGDFAGSQAKLYKKTLLPQLPFFSMNAD